MLEFMHGWDPNLRPPVPGLPPIRRAQASALGVTLGQLRGPAWRQSSRGYYLPSTAPADSPSQRIAEAAVMLPPEGAIGGWAAGYWLGAALLDGLGPDGRTLLPVLLCLSEHGQIRHRPGIQLSRDRLPPTDVLDFRGLRCTAPLRTAFDGARLAPNLTEAVVHLDVLAHTGLVSLEALDRYVAAHPRWRGVEQARRAVALADPGSRSPAESRLRMLWRLEAGLPQPLVNVPVFDPDYQLLGIVDLLDREAGVVAEYDGADHRDAEQHTADNAREELLEEHALIVVRVTGLDLWRSSAQTAARLRRARLRGLRRDRSNDRWSLDPPPWRGGGLA